MIVVLLIALLTSRYVLKALDVDDFGLYNVVGGVVGMLTFFNGTMLKSTQRFLNFAMVKNNKALASIFSSSITIHVLIVLIFIFLCETIGIWFLNYKINIPEGRELAANIVFQSTILSFSISILTIPYNAAVVAYEKMTFMAVVSIIDAVLKLGIAICLLYYSDDRLSLYGILLLFITVLNFFLYFYYCKKKYPVLKFKISYNKENFKQLFSFISWTLVGQMAVVGCNQGNVVLVNMFHALSANAAMSVGSQVSNAINNLTTNFQTAFNPQITKSYAEENYTYIRSLVYITSKLSFSIMIVVALPVVFNIDWLLNLWLDNVPPLSNIFATLFMINGIINAISTPFNYTVLSSGRIRTYQIVSASVFLLDLPFTYVLFCIGLPAISVLWVKIFVMTIIFFVRVLFASSVVNTISVSSVFREVLMPIIFISSICVFGAFYFNEYAYSFENRMLFTIILDCFCISLIWIVCLSKEERRSLVRILKR